MARFGAAAALLLLLPASPARAAPPERAEIVEYGEYVAARDLGEPDPALRSDTLAGVRLSSEPHFTTRSERVEGRYCNRFGIRFRVLPPALRKLTVRLDHPTWTRPDGATGATDWFEVLVGAEPGFAGFSFDESWTLVPGAWTISVLDGEQVLASQRFTVTDGDRGVLPDGGCSVPVS